MSDEETNEPLWCPIVEVDRPIIPLDEGVRALGDEGDLDTREHMQWIADLAGYCAFAPFRLDDPLNVGDLRIAWAQLEQHVRWVANRLAALAAEDVADGAQDGES